MEELLHKNINFYAKAKVKLIHIEKYKDFVHLSTKIKLLGHDSYLRMNENSSLIDSSELLFKVRSITTFLISFKLLIV